MPPRTYYLLSEAELRSHGYPPHPDGSESFFADTAQWSSHAGSSHPRHALLALDCEMCMTHAGPALTRVCVVSEKGEVRFPPASLLHILLRSPSHP